MKIRVNEAESDYIKIGNMILPKNASGYGYDDYSTVASKAKAQYNKEKEDERKSAEAKRQAELDAKVKAKGKEQYDKFMEIYNANQDSDTNSLMSALFDEFVPDSGACDNLGAELIRAIERIRYRDYNDGDFYYKGYGLETCGPCAAFIADYSNETLEDEIIDIASKNYSDYDSDYYTRDLEQLARQIVEFLSHNPDIFGKSPVDSIDYKGSLVYEWEEASHSLEYEPDVSSEWLYNLIDRDCISWDDVEQFLNELARYYGGTVNAWARDGFTIIDLDEDEYNQWEDNFPNEFESWVDDLINEYGEYDEDEDAEDEEDW